jgi:hypothetical protein
LNGGFQPFGQTGLVPVENDFFEKRTADKHDQPIAIKRNPSARRGHVIKVGYAVTEPAPDRLEAIKQNQKRLAALEFAEVFGPFRKSRVDVITLNVAAVVGWLFSKFPFAPVAAEIIQHQLYGVTLAVVWRRHVGKDKQFHL